MIAATLMMLSAGAATSAAGQNNPVPFINQPLVPDSVAPGGPGFTLTVNGTGFVSGSAVNWNGTAIATAFVSSSQLAAAVPGSSIGNAGAVSITVANPLPGGGISNTAFLVIANPVSPLVFSRSDFLAGTGPRSACTADFNGDGRLDLAVANVVANTVSVLLGNGDGTFQPHTDWATGNGPGFVMAGDFNGDGNPDLAVANSTSNTISILLGNGDGTFRTHVDYATGASPFSGGAADVNGDGRLDLAVGNYSGSTVSILLGNGDGTFSAHIDYPTGSIPVGITIGDFNSDGVLDLAAADDADNSVSVLLGNGDGTFQTQIKYPAGSTPNSVVTGDFNGDGHLDLATTNFGGNTVSILLGIGNGTFQGPVSYVTGVGPTSVGLGDFTADGKLDLVVSNYYDSTISILAGHGDGSFGPKNDFGSGQGPYSVTTGDFNQDGMLDVAVAGRGITHDGDTVSVLTQIVAPTVVLAPASLTFAAQQVGTASPPQTVTLTNAGNAALNITSINITGSNPQDFSESSTCGTTLGTGASCTISVTFAPTSGGTRTASVTISDNAAGSPQQVTLSGTGFILAVGISPTSVTFPTQVVFTTSKPQIVTLTNTGTRTVTISSIAATGQFSETNACGASLNPGANCTLTVTFRPVSKGTLKGSVMITDNAPGSPQSVSLTGTGTFVQLTPTSENFGSQPIHTTSLPKRIALTNKGSSAVNITSIVIAGADPTDFTQTNTCGMSVASGATCYITVAFTPTAIGKRTAGVSISDDGGGSPQQVNLIGLGTL